MFADVEGLQTAFTYRATKSRQVLDQTSVEFTYEPGESDPVDDLADRGWPAEHRERHGGWILRAAGGVTKRANSALPVGPVDDPEAALDAVEAFARAHGIDPCVQVSPASEPADLASLLAARGYAAEARTLVQVADAGATRGDGGDEGGDLLRRPPVQGQEGDDLGGQPRDGGARDLRLQRGTPAIGQAVQHVEGLGGVRGRVGDGLRGRHQHRHRSVQAPAERPGVGQGPLGVPDRAADQSPHQITLEAQLD